MTKSANPLTYPLTGEPNIIPLCTSCGEPMKYCELGGFPCWVCTECGKIVAVEE